MNIKRITNATYTGGGIYVFTGETESGSWFLFSTEDEEITLVNEDPSDLDTSLYWEWQEPRIVGYASEAEMADVYRWLLDHPMDDNYLPSDIEQLLAHTEIKEGMIVRFHPDWCTAAERKDLLLVLESYPDVRRCLAQYLNTDRFLPPTTTLTWDMVVPTGFDVNDLDQNGEFRELD